MTAVVTRIQEQVNDRRMLDHDFYQRWSHGALTLDELRTYARQYYHFTSAFPTFVSGIHANMADLTARQVMLENLIEEERGEENHPALWLQFCSALGLTADEVRASTPNAQTRELIATMRALTNSPSTHCGLASLYAYESQIPAVSVAKMEGLRKYFGITAPADVAFFAVHAEADVVHSHSAEELLNDYCATENHAREAVAAARQTVDALYSFLDGVNTREC